MSDSDKFDEILKKQKEMAIIQANLSLMISDSLNKQSTVNSRILSYLENDNKTNTIGVIQRSVDNERRLDKLEIKDRVRVGQATVIAVIFGFIGSMVIKLFNTFWHS